MRNLPKYQEARHLRTPEDPPLQDIRDLLAPGKQRATREGRARGEGWPEGGSAENSGRRERRALLEFLGFRR